MPVVRYTPHGNARLLNESLLDCLRFTQSRCGDAPAFNRRRAGSAPTPERGQSRARSASVVLPVVGVGNIYSLPAMFHTCGNFLLLIKQLYYLACNLLSSVAFSTNRGD
jgi:hypothetical protein